ncbi:MAG: ABC transporter substrate-binding protein [Phycisphaerales bacterium]|nr:MAG: ABC transporter substrate-binding protein [Phycisphaerales bacterium]
MPRLSLNHRIIFRQAGAYIALLLMLAWTSPVVGQQTDTSPTVYRNWESFDTRKGLPHNSIRTIRIIDDQVWVGTEGGLASYNGHTWQSWTKDDGLPAHAISSIDIDGDTGELWLGTWGHGLIRFSAGRFDPFTQVTSGLAGDLIFAVRCIEGRVLAATNAGISVFDPHASIWDLKAGRRADEPESVITQMSVVGANLFTAGWGKEPQKSDWMRGEWHDLDLSGMADVSYRAASGDTQNPVIGLAGTEESLWALTNDKLFHHTAKTGWRALDLPAPADAGGFARCLAAPSDSEVWVGTNDGLHAMIDWDTNTWITYRRCEPGHTSLVIAAQKGRIVAIEAVGPTIPDNRVRCIALDQDAVWVGTANGLACLSRPEPWKYTSGQGNGTATACPQSAQPAVAAFNMSDETQGKESITLGVLGPRARPIALPGGNRRQRGDARRPDPLAVQYAVDKANTSGSHGRSRFDLEYGVGGYRRYGWHSPEDDFTTFLYEDQAAAAIAYLGPEYVYRSAAAFYTELPVINVAAVAESKEDNLIDNPWVFRCFGDEPRQHRLLLDYVFDELGYTRLAALRTPTRVTQRHLNWWASHADARGHPLVADIPHSDDAQELDDVLDAIRRSGCEALLTWTDAKTTASVVRRMRDLGMRQLVVGGRSIVNDLFARSVGDDHGQVIALFPARRLAQSEAMSDFSDYYTQRNVRGGTPIGPGPDAHSSLDAANHLIEAINTVGRDREAIRRQLDLMSRSAAGEAHYERLHPEGKAVLAHLDAGRWRYKPIP